MSCTQDTEDYSLSFNQLFAGPHETTNAPARLNGHSSGWPDFMDVMEGNETARRSP